MTLAKVEDETLPSSILIHKSDTALNPCAFTHEARVAIFLLSDLIVQDSKVKPSWKYPETPGKIKNENNLKGSRVVFITEPSKALRTAKDIKGFLDLYQNILDKISNDISIPLLFIASTRLDDNFSTPRPGIWQLIQKQLSVPITLGFVVGSKAGRLGDKSAKHRHFAMNFGLSFYTPEEYFANKRPQPFKIGFNPKAVARIERDDVERQYKILVDDYLGKQEIVITCGIPGCGKTTLAKMIFESRGYTRINQDNLKTRAVCLRVARKHLREGSSIIVDNTNRNEKTRKIWIDLANEFKLPIRLIEIECSRDLAMHNALIRSLHIDDSDEEPRQMLPLVAFGDFLSKYQKPSVSEGFQTVTSIPFRYCGKS